MGPQEHTSGRGDVARLASDLYLTALIDAVLIFISSIILDGGALFRLVGSAVCAHIAGSAFVFLRRRTSPTRCDYMFVKWGLWPLLLACFAIFQTFQHIYGR